MKDNIWYSGLKKEKDSFLHNHLRGTVTHDKSAADSLGKYMRLNQRFFTKEFEFQVFQYKNHYKTRFRRKQEKVK